MARWENGDPVEDLEVQFSGWIETDGRQAGGELARTKTDAQGRYSLTVPAPLDTTILSAYGTENADGVWIPAQGECEAATSDGSQLMGFRPLSKDVANANWVLKPWPDRPKADLELEELKNKQKALERYHRDTRQKAVPANRVDEDPHALDPRNMMAHEYLRFERENRGEDVALKALIVVLNNASKTIFNDTATDRTRNEAIDRLIDHYLEHKDLADALNCLDSDPTVPSDTRLLTRAIHSSPHPDVVAAALYVRVTRIKDTIRDTEMLPQWTTVSDRYSLRGVARKTVADRMERLRIANVDQLRQTADKLLTRLTAEFGNLSVWTNSSTTYSEQATALRFAISKVQAGKQVPELEIQDVDGKPFRFADYKGKYIVLTFCHITNHSRVQADHHKLKDMLSDLPLHFVTVCEGNPEIEMSDGPNGNLGTVIWEGSNWGPIATAWAISGIPTTYVIDNDGMLRPQINGTMTPMDNAANVIRGLARQQ